MTPHTPECIRARLENPTFMKKFHGWATVLWLLASVPISIFLSTSVPFLVFISVYAVYMGHFGSWQSVRVEEKQTEEIVDETEQACS